MTAHNINVRVYYEDTDAAGIVYHTSYLRFAERGRTEILRDAGYSHAELLKTKGIAFAVVSMNIEFHAPAILDDLLTVSTKITRLGGASMDMQQNISKDNESICDIKLTLVCMNSNKNAVRLPKDIRQLFKEV